MDYLVTAPGIDPRRIVVTGHSRTGKAALVAAAFDERIALAIPHQAGCGGSAPSRARIAIGKPYNTLDTPQTKPPETVANINDKFPHWFNARFKEFNIPAGAVAVRSALPGGALCSASGPLHQRPGGHVDQSRGTV